MAYWGDVVGCKALFDKIQDGRIDVAFTLNGKEVGKTSMSYLPGNSDVGDIYPYVGMGDKDISVLFRERKVTTRASASCQV